MSNPSPTSPRARRLNSNDLLQLIADAERGGDVDKLLEDCTHDHCNGPGIFGICITCKTVVDDCEPDADANMCEECETETVQSALILAGMI